MKYVSTRGNAEPADFVSASLIGLAPDGYPGSHAIPLFIGNVRNHRMKSWSVPKYSQEIKCL
jgi:hypothetical protein